MKALLSILILLGVFFVGWKTWVYWQEVQKNEQGEETGAEIIESRYFEGMPSNLEKEFRETATDTDGLKRFLDRYSHLVKDPRLAALELDYLVAISSSDPVESKRLFLKVKERIPPDSRLYPRIKALEATYQ